MATAGRVRLTGTTNRRDEYCVARFNELPLAVQGTDRKDAVRELLKALKTYLEANGKLGQTALVMERLGYSGRSVEEYFERLLSALGKHTKTDEQNRRVSALAEGIKWGHVPDSSQQGFTLEIPV